MVRTDRMSRSRFLGAKGRPLLEPQGRSQAATIGDTIDDATLTVLRRRRSAYRMGSSPTQTIGTTILRGRNATATLKSNDGTEVPLRLQHFLPAAFLAAPHDGMEYARKPVSAVRLTRSWNQDWKGSNLDKCRKELQHRSLCAFSHNA